MDSEIISMSDMMSIYDVTDRFDIDREQITVPLEKKGLGNVYVKEDGILEIIVPVDIPVTDWLSKLWDMIKDLGYIEETLEWDGWFLENI